MSAEIIQPPQHPHERVRASLAQLVLGITLDMDEQTALLVAHQTLTGDNLTPEALQTESDRLRPLDLAADWHTIPPNDRERKIALNILAAALSKEGKMHANLLGNWPFHQHLFEKYVPEAERGTVGTALLVGAHHSLTARTFDVMAREVYGAKQALIIDIAAGKDLARHGTFAYGNALAMPFASGSLDIIQTNQLFNWLSPELWKEDTATKEQNAHKMLVEASRVLRPGGRIFLCEDAIDARFDEDLSSDYNQGRVAAFYDLLSRALPKCGFVDIAIEPVFLMRDSSYIFDETRAFDDAARTEHPVGLGVYARKAGDSSSIALGY